MRRSSTLAALIPVVLAACGDAPMEPARGSATTPAFELVIESQVMDARRVNVSVQGTFQVLAGDPPRVLGTGGREEPANFPGHPPLGPGTCLDGRWFNARGHGTSGSVDNPHPHCFDPGTGGITIVLEPISSQLLSTPEVRRTTLVLSNLDDVYVHYEAQPAECRERPCYQQGGWGTVAAYAIDAATGVRVGTLKFEISPPRMVPGQDPFACSLDGDPAQTGCINAIYTANYHPLAPEDGGQGTSQQVQGFLYWFMVGR